MKLFFRVLDRVLETMLFLALAFMCGIVATNVFCRFVLNFSLSWGDELAQILLVWFTFLGAAVGVRDKVHYKFDYLVRAMPGRSKKYLILFSELAVILTSVGLLYWSTKVTISIRHWIMPATEISRALVYGACPVGTFFLLIYALRNFFRELHVTPELPPIEEEVLL